MKVFGVSKTNLKNILIPFPPTLAEQTAIANALSETDALIAELENLIAKKQNIKQATMQLLLTGKKRLKGFKGEWELRKLSISGNCYAGGTPSTFNPKYWNGDIIWLPSGRVQNNIIKKIAEEKTITQLGLDESAAKLIKPKSVLIAITGATCGNIGLLEFSATANQSVVAIEPNNKTEYRFLYYKMLTMRNQILMNQTGSAQGGVNLKAIKNLEILFPPKEEQTAIADILSDMDNEIETLQQQLSKYKLMKEGMMQNLLTGKVRLV
jgi:type I restriction enzyme S subunit